METKQAMLISHHLCSITGLPHNRIHFTIQLRIWHYFMHVLNCYILLFFSVRAMVVFSSEDRIIKCSDLEHFSQTMNWYHHSMKNKIGQGRVENISLYFITQTVKSSWKNRVHRNRTNRQSSVIQIHLICGHMLSMGLSLVCDLNRTPVVMAKHGGSCVHFSGVSTCRGTSRETVSHPQCPPLPTLYKISLPVYVVTNKRLQPLTTIWYDILALSCSLLKI